MRFALLVLGFSAIFAAADPAPVPYPEDYRNWIHVKSMVILPGHGLYEAFGGIHHIYANSAAASGYRTGEFEDGAVIVFDLLDAENEENAIVEGSRKVVGVMYRDSQAYADTGGWGFEGFKADSHQRIVGDDATTACYQCHTAVANQAYVFSSWRE